MKEIIPMDDYGIFCDATDTLRVSSLIVAQMFEKEHRNVLRSIENLTANDSGLSKDFVKLNFELNNYRDEYNRKHPCYAMTRDGFAMLVMGFTGNRAMRFKEAYIKRFNEMERTIKSLITARHDFPLLTEQIRIVHDNPKPYHFTNECDMLNRLVIGMTAKQFRIANNIPDGKSIRPSLSQEQIETLELLQKVDIGLLVALPDYAQRKRQLEWFLYRRKEIA